MNKYKIFSKLRANQSLINQTMEELSKKQSYIITLVNNKKNSSLALQDFNNLLKTLTSLFGMKQSLVSDLQKSSSKDISNDLFLKANKAYQDKLNKKKKRGLYL